MKAIAYYRVSTISQGKSGLGLEAQQASVTSYATAHNYEIVNTFTDIESGKKDDRSQLQQALSECKKNKAVLIIAKLDRLSRDLHFITGIMKTKVDFVCVDNPHANKLTLQIIGAMAEYEREQISIRTKQGLEAAKARGVQLGSHGKVLAAQKKAQAIQEAQDLAPYIGELNARGITSVRAIAKELGKHPTQVARILSRLR